MKNGNKKHFDVFISYRRDKGFGIARSIYAELVFRGYRVFMDTEHLGPGEFDEELLARIKKAKDIIFILTSGSLDIDYSNGKDPGDDWFRKEIEAALSADIRPNIMPIKDSKFQWPSDSVLKADGIARGIDVLKFKRWEAETFIPTQFSVLIDRFTGTDTHKVFRLRSRPVVKYWYRFKTIVTVGLLLVGLLWGAVSKIRSVGKYFGLRHDPVVLVGSGTVSNYLRREGIERKDQDVIIIDSPSNYALKLLHEAKNSERGHCHVIFMSAKQMKGDYFKENGIDTSGICVVEVNLHASDKLQVILKPFHVFTPLYIATDAKTINIGQLAKILNTFQSADDTFIYRTSLESGTYTLFKDAFSTVNYELPMQKNVSEFYESDKGSCIHMATDEKCIVLCGSLYKPQEDEYKCKGLEGKLLDVVDARGRNLEKPLYLYFVVSKENPIVPEAIDKFLNNIGRSDVLNNITMRNLEKEFIYRDN